MHKLISETLYPIWNYTHKEVPPPHPTHAPPRLRLRTSPAFQMCRKYNYKHIYIYRERWREVGTPIAHDVVHCVADQCVLM